MRVKSKFFISSIIVGCYVFFSYAFAAEQQVGNEPHTAHAILLPEETATISSQIDGYIETLPLKIGQSFEKGSVLVQFNCNINQAELNKAKAGLNAKKAEYQSSVKLKKMNAISEAEYSKAVSDYQALEAEVAIKQHNVQMCTIKAPFSGQLIELDVHAHENVKKAQPLLKIVDNNSLRAEILIPSAWLQWLKVGNNFKVAIDETGQEYSAIVTKIIPKVDSVSQVVLVHAKIQGEHAALISGMSGTAIFKQE